MEEFVDMHCHILYGVDDGAENMLETKEMLKIAYNHGTRTLIATPHHHPVRGSESTEVIKRQYEIAKQIASEISSDLKILLGMEIYFGQDIAKELKKDQLLTMNDSNVILVEFNPESNFDYIYSSLWQLQLAGYRVIIAHIERYDCFIKNPELVYDIYNQGIYIQINADSITGKNGFKVKKFVKDILNDKLVYCVGSGAHDSKKRIPALDKAYSYVVRKYGSDYADSIFRDNILEIC